ncbi:hypothetical protein HK102_003425 [Quaeritorhiza haematococci]|nr:hypothetical protein HK102_003425 [Quaeritorhiza haematococci]
MVTADFLPPPSASSLGGIHLYKDSHPAITANLHKRPLSPALVTTPPPAKRQKTVRFAPDETIVLDPSSSSTMHKQQLQQPHHSRPTKPDTSGVNAVTKELAALTTTTPVKRSETQAEIAVRILRAIKAKTQGDFGAYNDILRSLRAKQPSPAALSPDALFLWLRALAQVVSSLTPAQSAIVDAVLTIDWVTSQREDLVLSYHSLLENLVSAHSFYFTAVVKMLIGLLRCDDYRRQDICNQVSNRVHTILRSLVSLIPTGPSTMLPMITNNFPHKSESLHVHVNYLDNILKMIDYVPVLRNSILSIIIDRVLQIDVEIQVDLEDLDEEHQDELHDYVFNNENLSGRSVLDGEVDGAVAEGLFEPLKDDESSDVNTDSEDDSDLDSDLDRPMVVINFKLMVDKLDAMLSILLRYLQDFARRVRLEEEERQVTEEDDQGEEFESGQLLESEKLHDLFHNLLEIFERAVLPTYRSRFTQFLWFYACSLDPSFPDMFMGLLVTKTFDATLPVVTRVTAAAYLASYIARAKYLDLDTVRTCLKLLSGWTYAFVEQNEGDVSSEASSPSSSPPLERGYGVKMMMGGTLGGETSMDRSGSGLVHPASTRISEFRKHIVFYSVVQAIIYIFCFRWRELLVDADCQVIHGQFPAEMVGFQKVIMSKFNPLQVCTMVIVEEFAMITHRLEIMYCYSLLQNSRKSMSSYPPAPTSTTTSSALKSTSSPGAGAGNAVNSSNGTLPITTDPNVVVVKPSKQSTNDTSSLPHHAPPQPTPLMNSDTETLDAYFPFDPLHLSNCEAFVEGLYNEFQAIADDDED